MDQGKGTDEGQLSGEQAIVKVRQMLAGFRSAMMMTRSDTNSGVDIRPMGLQRDAEVFGGALHFFADDRSRKVAEIGADPHTALIFQNDEQTTYLHLVGTASVVNDKAKMRELFTPLVKTWFPDGLADPHLTLIRFDAEEGHYWENPGGALRLLGAFAKSAITGVPGKGGVTGSLTM